MNYGEEYVYWYLRLNGFFPISNFVIHKSSQVMYSSDCDILAVRPPYVYEEIGGKPKDWDSALVRQLNFDRTIGVICEVKTGGYDLKDIFKPENVKYSIGRLGFVAQGEIDRIVYVLETTAVVDINHQYQICKLLIANSCADNDSFLFRDLHSVRAFLHMRVRKYPKEKYRDRMFFSSTLFQSIIDTVALERDLQNQIST